MASKISRTQTSKRPQFDPKKNYKWEPDDIFELSGLDFSTIYNTLKEAALAPKGTSAINIVASFNLATQMLAKGVEEGIIVEMPNQASSEAPGEVEAPKKTRKRNSKEPASAE